MSQSTTTNMPTLTIKVTRTITISYKDIEDWLMGSEGVSDRIPTGQTEPKHHLIWKLLCKQVIETEQDDDYSDYDIPFETLFPEASEAIDDAIQDAVCDIDDEEEEMNKKYPHLQERCVLCDKVLTDAYEFWRSPKPLKQEGNCCLECYYDKVVPAEAEPKDD